MSSVYRDTTVTLTDEEKNILTQAIRVCEQIARDCNDEDMFVDASTIFGNAYDNYDAETLQVAIKIMHKYQKIEQIVNNYISSGKPYISVIDEDIKEVLEDEIN